MTTADPNTLLRAEFPPHLLRDHPTLTAGKPTPTAAQRTAPKLHAGIQDVGQPWAHSRLAHASAAKRPAPDSAVHERSAVRPECSNTGSTHPRTEQRPVRELDG